MFEKNEEWETVKDKESFLIYYYQNSPAYSAILVKRSTLIDNEYFNFYFKKKDYKKFGYEPDEIMTASILCIFNGETKISGKVVSVRGSFGDNYSQTDHWRNTYRSAVAMPLVKLHCYFKKKNKVLANHYLKLAIFRYCFVPLNIKTLIYFKNIYIAISMIFSRIYFKFRFIRGVNFVLRKIINLDNILKKN